MLTQYIKVYLKQVYKKAWSLGDSVSTVLSGIIPIVTHFMPKLQATADLHIWQVPIFGLFGAVVFRAFAAPYDIWKEQGKTIANVAEHLHTLTKNISDLKAERPSLIGKIESANWGGQSERFDRAIETIIILQVKISNVGKVPSGATEWGAFLVNKSLGTIHASPMHNANDVILRNAKAIITFKEEDAIIVSGEKPISPGEIRRGFIMIKVYEAASVIEAEPCTVYLEFDDVYSNRSRFQLDLSWVKGERIIYVPGTRMAPGEQSE